jgi:hypothetical protein
VSVDDDEPPDVSVKIDWWSGSEGLGLGDGDGDGAALSLDDDEPPRVSMRRSIETATERTRCAPSANWTKSGSETRSFGPTAAAGTARW